MCREHDLLQEQLSGFEVDDGEVRRPLQLEDLPLREWLESLLLWNGEGSGLSRKTGEELPGKRAGLKTEQLFTQTASA